MFKSKKFSKLLPMAATLAMLVLLSPPAPIEGQETNLDSQGRPLYVPGEVLVELHPGMKPSSLGFANQSMMAANVAVLPERPAPSLFRVRLKPGTLMKAAVAALQSDPAVKMAGPNYYNYPLLTPNDTFWGDMWNMVQVGAETAWDTATGLNVVIAVIDTGVDYTHPDLAGNIFINVGETADNGLDDDSNGYIDDVNGYDFVDGDNDAYPVGDNHGTHVAGTAAAIADDAFGIPGMAFGAQIMPLKVFPDNGLGAPDSAIIAAIAYAHANGADIVNLSLGRDGTEPAGMASEIITAIAAGSLIVAAAGNGGADWVSDDNDATPHWPANFADEAAYPATAPGVIAVAATDNTDTLASFSNYGKNSVSIAAPGTTIKSTVTGRDNVWLEDTSGVVGTSASCLADDTTCFDNTDFNNGATDCTGGNCQWGWSKPSVTWYAYGDLSATAGGFYTDDIDGIIQLSVDLTGVGARPILRYAAGWDTKCAGGADYVDVTASGDNGATWTPVLAQSNLLSINDLGNAYCYQPHTHIGRMYSFFGSFQTISHPLPVQVGAGPTLVRFTFASDAVSDTTALAGAVRMRSFYIDAQTADYSNAFGSKQGTSMASPLVAGVAALVKEANPGFTPAEIKTRILESGDVVAELKCKVVSGKRVNAANAVAGTVTGSNACSGGGGGSKSASSDGGGGCLISWITEGYLADSTLDPLRSVRDYFWQQGEWGQSLVRWYYSASEVAIAWLEGGESKSFRYAAI